MCLTSLRVKITFQTIFCVLFIFSWIVYADRLQSKHRVKRRVVFTSSSKFFFRLNGKLNTLNYTEFFATGYTMRINYDLPSTIQKRFKFFKRDIHSDITNIPDRSAVKGVSCLLKHFCDILLKVRFSKSCGFFCGIVDIITGEHGIEGNFFKNFVHKCHHYQAACQHSREDHSIFGFG